MIRERCNHFHGLPKQQCNIDISGIFSSKKLRTSTVNLLIVPMNKAFNVKAIVMPKLTDLIPTEQINVKSCIQINTLKLADPIFNTPKQVDIILGSDIFEDVILHGKQQEFSGPNLQNTVFRWKVSAQTTDKLERTQTAVVVLQTDTDLRSFCEMEEGAMYKKKFRRRKDL